MDSVDAKSSVDTHCAALYSNVLMWAIQLFVAFHYSAICLGQNIAVLGGAILAAVVTAITSH